MKLLAEILTVVIPNADLFTHSVIVNTAGNVRRWEYDFSVKGTSDLAELKSVIINAVRKVPGTFVGTQSRGSRSGVE